MSDGVCVCVRACVHAHTCMLFVCREERWLVLRS